MCVYKCVRLHFQFLFNRDKELRSFYLTTSRLLNLINKRAAVFHV